MGLERLHFHLKALPNVLTSTYTTTPYIFGKQFLFFGGVGRFFKNNLLSVSLFSLTPGFEIGHRGRKWAESLPTAFKAF